MIYRISCTYLIEDREDFPANLTFCPILYIKHNYGGNARIIMPYILQ